MFNISCTFFFLLGKNILWLEWSWVSYQSLFLWSRTCSAVAAAGIAQMALVGDVQSQSDLIHPDFDSVSWVSTPPTRGYGCSCLPKKQLMQFPKECQRKERSTVCVKGCACSKCGVKDSWCKHYLHRYGNLWIGGIQLNWSSCSRWVTSKAFSKKNASPYNKAHNNLAT